MDRFISLETTKYRHWPSFETHQFEIETMHSIKLPLLQSLTTFSLQLLGVEAFLAHHHAGDVGPPPAWGGIADDGPDAPCAVAGMFG
jgi:hypothetical protein